MLDWNVEQKDRDLAVGCVCAGRMEGDVEGAKRREAEFKNRQARRVEKVFCVLEKMKENGHCMKEGI